MYDITEYDQEKMVSRPFVAHVPALKALHSKVDVFSTNSPSHKRKELGLAAFNSEIQAIRRTYAEIRTQLGSWASQNYIQLIHSQIHATNERHRHQTFQSHTINSTELIHALPPNDELSPNAPGGVSDKVTRLVTYLLNRVSQRSTGIIFVQQRATTIMLCKVLRRVLESSDLPMASFVGTSNCSLRRSTLGDITAVSAQADVLEEFREGKIRLLIATNVLEEGIDISSCNMVVCFDPPQNVKSFIQRRGRARDQHSEFVIMTANNGADTKITEWQKGEEEMMRLASADRWEHEQLRLMEDASTEGEQVRFRVPETG